MLGTVPILIRHPYAHAYAGLPVVLIDRFEEITQANLEVWYRKFAPLLNDPVRLQALLDPEAGWSKILAATPGASRHDGASAFTREGQGTADTSSPSSGACGMSENGVEAYVFVRFQGGMANTMIQYAIGRIIATKLNIGLRFPDGYAWTSMFPNVSSHLVEGQQTCQPSRAVSKGSIYVIGDNEAPKRCAAAKDSNSTSAQCRSFVEALLELAAMTALPEHIQIFGHFEDYDILQPHKEEIHNWFAPATSRSPPRAEGESAVDQVPEGVEVAVHIRVCEANVPEGDRVKGGSGVQCPQYANTCLPAAVT